MALKEEWWWLRSPSVLFIYLLISTNSSHKYRDRTAFSGPCLKQSWGQSSDQDHRELTDLWGKWSCHHTEIA